MKSREYIEKKVEKLEDLRRQLLKEYQDKLDKFKFQYDNTLSQAHQAQPIQTHKFKFQYDNTLSNHIHNQLYLLQHLNSNMIIL